MLVALVEITRATERATSNTAASRIFKTRMETLDVESDSTVVVTQSRVELPLFPGQPIELPLHTPFLQVLSSMLLLLLLLELVFLLLYRLDADPLHFGADANAIGAKWDNMAARGPRDAPSGSGLSCY